MTNKINFNEKKSDIHYFIKNSEIFVMPIITKFLINHSFYFNGYDMLFKLRNINEPHINCLECDRRKKEQLGILHLSFYSGS